MFRPSSEHRKTEADFSLPRGTLGTAFRGQLRAGERLRQPIQNLNLVFHLENFILGRRISALIMVQNQNGSKMVAKLIPIRSGLTAVPVRGRQSSR